MEKAEFSNYISELKNRSDLLLTEDNEVFRDLNRHYKTIYDLLINVRNLARKFIDIYESIYIDKGFMSDDQIDILSREIDNFLRGYYRICDMIINKGDISKIYFINENDFYWEENIRDHIFIHKFIKGKFFCHLCPFDFTSAYKVITRTKEKLLN